MPARFVRQLEALVGGYRVVAACLSFAVKLVANSPFFYFLEKEKGNWARTGGWVYVLL